MKKMNKPSSKAMYIAPKVNANAIRELRKTSGMQGGQDFVVFNERDTMRLVLPGGGE